MTGNYTTGSFNKGNDNSHFKGLIYSGDFDTNYASSRNMVNRIVTDWAFDQFCRRNSETRQKQQKYVKGK